MTGPVPLVRFNFGGNLLSYIKGLKIQKIRSEAKFLLKYDSLANYRLEK